MSPPRRSPRRAGRARPGVLPVVERMGRAPAWTARLGGALLAVAALASEGGPPLARGDGGDEPVTPAAQAALTDAVAVFERARAERIIGQYANERAELFAGHLQVTQLFAEGRYEDLFVDGDAAFEGEATRALGLGRGADRRTPGAFLPWLRMPARGRPIHDDERGGLDASSCRSCHFAGGPDGAGSSSQRAFLRGDGAHVSSAAMRDAPHVMGLGYVALVAAEMTAELASHRARAAQLAATLAPDAAPVTIPLAVQEGDVTFGALVVRPTPTGGVVDDDGVQGVSRDLVVRPFGHKGRHADLVALADEALAVHHGLQSSAYLRRHRDDAARFLGDGPAVDPDDDGEPRVATAEPGAELGGAHAVLLASYLGMLGVPVIAPPRSPDLLVRFARGRAVFGAVGCTQCHVERLWWKDPVLRVAAHDGSGLQGSIDLDEHGRQPRATRVDYGPRDVARGVPLFLFSDLKRHDLGPGLADAVDEPLPRHPGAVDDNGLAAVPGAVWLTRPLWGLADTAPYLHDGRAPTLHDAIALHGGEAQAARDAYLALTDDDRAALRAFLASLTRERVVLVE
ncbi:MAG: hypothetical protein FJ137_19215 [Deltaproteobacteria bacterium]|nr:hypothetical protein [Deltaproteobacteria bacterium]